MSRRPANPWILSALSALSALASACSPELGSQRVDGDGRVQLAISGEAIATDGVAFPEGSEVTFVDGWALELTHVLVTVGNVTLAENPDLVPSDQSQMGPVVARAPGPWAIDLHTPGTLPAAGGEGLAIDLGNIDDESERGGAAFERDQRYAFSYDVLPAATNARVVNFAGDAEAEAAYAEMVDTGATVLYVGRAHFAGQDCATSEPSYDFSTWPTEVPFSLAFRTPTHFLNCQNQDNQGAPLPDEEAERGIAIPGHTSAFAQLTLHLEHAWFSASAHDPALRFDAMAAQLVGKPAGYVVTLDDLRDVDPTAITDGAGQPVPLRSCDGSPLPKGKQLRFDTGTVPVDRGSPRSQALHDLRDFVQYVQSTQGHLNGGEGLCYVQRAYPSPP